MLFNWTLLLKIIQWLNGQTMMKMLKFFITPGKDIILQHWVYGILRIRLRLRELVVCEEIIDKFSKNAPRCAAPKSCTRRQFIAPISSTGLLFRYRPYPYPHPPTSFRSDLVRAASNCPGQKDHFTYGSLFISTFAPPISQLNFFAPLLLV